MQSNNTVEPDTEPGKPATNDKADVLEVLEGLPVPSQPEEEEDSLGDFFKDDGGPSGFLFEDL